MIDSDVSATTQASATSRAEQTGLLTASAHVLLFTMALGCGNDNSRCAFKAGVTATPALNCHERANQESIHRQPRLNYKVSARLAHCRVKPVSVRTGSAFHLVRVVA